MTHFSAQRLKSLRLAVGFEQQDLARFIGVRPSTVARFENGKQNPGVAEICALLVTFRTSFETLFSADLELATADVFARVSEYQPPESLSHRTAKRADSLRALQAALNAPHGPDC